MRAGRSRAGFVPRRKVAWQADKAHLTAILPLNQPETGWKVGQSRLGELSTIFKRSTRVPLDHRSSRFRAGCALKAAVRRAHSACRSNLPGRKAPSQRLPNLLSQLQLLLLAAGRVTGLAPSSAGLLVLPPLLAFAADTSAVRAARRARLAARAACARTHGRAQSGNSRATTPAGQPAMALLGPLPMFVAPMRRPPAGSSGSPVPQTPCSAARSAPG